MPHSASLVQVPDGWQVPVGSSQYSAQLHSESEAQPTGFEPAGTQVPRGSHSQPLQQSLEVLQKPDS
jgi:hypothetical protein